MVYHSGFTFSFEFYESPVTHFKISGNGVLTFDTTAVALPGNVNTNLPAPPSANIPNKSVLALWDSFTTNPPTGSNDIVISKIFGTAPNRQLWVKYLSYEISDLPFSYSALVLEESTNNIFIVDTGYSSPSGSSTSTVGLQLNSTTAVQYADSTISLDQVGNSSSANNNSYYMFEPSLNDDAAIGKIITPEFPLNTGLQAVNVELKILVVTPSVVLPSIGK